MVFFAQTPHKETYNALIKELGHEGAVSYYIQPCSSTHYQHECSLDVCVRVPVVVFFGTTCSIRSQRIVNFFGDEVTLIVTSNQGTTASTTVKVVACFSCMFFLLLCTSRCIYPPLILDLFVQPFCYQHALQRSCTQGSLFLDSNSHCQFFT